MGALRFDTPTYTMGMCVITITWWPCACKLISPLHNCTCDKSDGCSVINAFLLWDEAHWIHDNEHHDCQNLSVRTCWIDSERWCTNIIQSSLWLNYSLIGPIVSTTRVSEVYHIYLSWPCNHVCFSPQMTSTSDPLLLTFNDVLNISLTLAYKYSTLAQLTIIFYDIGERLSMY